MCSLKITITILFALLSLAYSAPTFWRPKHEHIVVHVPFNIHTRNIHHIHVQHVPVYKHIPVIKHVPVYKEVPIVKEVAIPVHLPPFREGWHNQQWW